MATGIRMYIDSLSCLQGFAYKEQYYAQEKWFRNRKSPHLESEKETKKK